MLERNAADAFVDFTELDVFLVLFEHFGHLAVHGQCPLILLPALVRLRQLGCDLKERFGILPELGAGNGGGQGRERLRTLPLRF